MPTPPPRNATKKEQKKSPKEKPASEPRPAAQFTPSAAKLRDKVELFYKMMGSFVTPVGRWYSGATGIGEGLKEYSNEAADAWVELANENPEVKKILESMTSASAWGNVIGVHFVIISKINQQTEQVGNIMSQINDPREFLKAQGYSEEMIDQALNLATGVVQSERQPEEAIPEPVVVNPNPHAYENTKEAIPEPVVNPNPQVTTPSGMPSPARMGVTPEGEAQSHAHENTFPADPNGVKGSNNII